MGQNKSKEKLTNQVKKVLNDWWHQVQAKPILYALIFFFVMSIVSLDNILGTLQQTNINFTGAIWFGSLLLLSWLVLLRTAKQPRPVQVMTAGAVSLLIFFCIAESIRFLIRHQALSAKIWETGTFWTLAALLISSPVAFVVWRFRDENQSKDINLKEFQKISEWVTGAHFQEEKHSEKFSGSLPENADAAQPSERSREYYRPAASAQALHTFSKQDGAVGLQIAAVYNLLPFYRGDYGQAFEKPSVHLLHSAWKVLQHDILQELESADDDETREKLIKQLHQRADSPLGQAITRVLLACDYADKPLLHRHPEILPGIYLSGMDFMLAGLEHEILRDTLFCGHDFNGTQFQGVRGTKKFNFSNMDLYNANLSNMDCREANFHNSILEDTYLNSTDFSYADFSKAQLDRANIHKSLLVGAIFEHACLEHIKISDVNLTDVNCKDASFKNSVISNSSLYHGACQHTDWSDAQLHNIIIEKTDFYESYLDRLTLCDSHIIESDLSKSSLYKIKLKNSELHQVSLLGAVNLSDLLEAQSMQGCLISECAFVEYEKSIQNSLMVNCNTIVLSFTDEQLNIENELICFNQKNGMKLSYPSKLFRYRLDLGKAQKNNPDWEISIK